MLSGAQNFRLMSFFVHSPLIPWHHLLENNTQTHQNDWCMISKCCDMIGARYIPYCGDLIGASNIPLYTLTLSFFFWLKKIVSKMVPNDDEPDKSKRQG